MIVKALVTSLSNADFVKPEFCDTTSNFVGVIGKILELYPDELKLEEERIFIVNIWLNMLPLKSNIDIAYNIHEQLIKMVEFNYTICQGHFLLLLYMYLNVNYYVGTNVLNYSMSIPKLVEIINENLASKETSEKILRFLYNFDLKNPNFKLKEMIVPEAISRAS